MVSDNGPGIENQIDKNTNSFIDRSKLRIGLMTIYLIAEKYNSNFEIMYDKNQGNIYRFIFNKG